MSIKSKYLADAGWKDLASKNKVKDNGLTKALERLKRVDDQKHDEQTRALDDVVKLAAQLKKDKALVSLQAVARYLAEVQADAESALRDVAKAKAEHEKAQRALAEAEKKAAARRAASEEPEEGDDEAESPDLLTSKLKPLLKLVAKGDTMHTLLAKSGKQVVVMLSRKPIPPARRKLLADQLGGGSTKYYPGTCSLEAGAMTFALKAEVAGMSKLVKAALLEQTGLRLNKIKCRGEDGDDHDDDEAPAGPDAAGDPDAGSANPLLAAWADDDQRGPATGASSAGAQAQAATLTIVTLSGASDLLAGSTERFRATLVQPGGASRDVTGEVTWHPSDPDVQINSMGYGEIKTGPGRLEISATHAKTGAKGSITVFVLARILKKIAITPRDPMILVGESVPLRALGEFSDGTTDDVTFTVTWESNHKEFAEPHTTGSTEGKARGTALISAIHPSTMVADGTTVTVHDVGKAPKLVKLQVTPEDPTVVDFRPLRFRAMGEFADKSKHDVTRRVRWVSDRTNLMSIDATGEATPWLPSHDSVWITAVDDTTRVHARCEVTMKLPSLLSIEVTPIDPSVPAGGVVTLTATGTYADRSTRDITARLTWTTNNAGAASPVANSPGLIDCPAEGEAEITARDTVSGRFDVVTVKVLPPPP